jgi:L-amino acid N-acyltransferase YncA
MIRSVTLNDAAEIAEIYNYYILNTTVTFEEQIVSVDTMKSRIEEVTSKYSWLIYEYEGKIVGYAYATSWKPRNGYRYSVETSVYLQNGTSGKGIGSALYSELISGLRSFDVHAIIGGMALPNDASIALHKKFGFEQVAHFKETGFKFGKWVDVAYWEKILK